MKYFRKIDFFGPEVKIKHESIGSIFSSIISIICIVLIIFAVFYFSRSLIWRKSPQTQIYEVYAYEDDSYSINSTFFSHFITNIDYQTLEFKFNFTYYRIIGMQHNLNIYLNFYGGNISRIDHWLYGPCDTTKDFIEEKNEYVIGLIKSSACIMKYYDSKKYKYYDRDDKNFKWPKLTYGEVGSTNELYSIVIEKNKEDTLNVIMGGKNNQCSNDSEFNESLINGSNIGLFYRDNYINLLDYDKPNKNFIDYMENTMEQNFLSTNILSFTPLTIRTNTGFFFNKIKEKKLYEFESNILSTLPKHQGEENVYMNHIIILNNKMKNYERTYKRIQDICAEVGGFIQALYFFAEFIVKFYNEYRLLNHTKKIISNLYFDKERINKDKIEYLNSKKRISSIIININNRKKIDEKGINLNMDNIKQNTEFNTTEDVSEISKKDISPNVSQISKSPSKNEKDNDNKSVFNKENQNLNMFSYLIHRLTFSQAFKKYNIYKDFRNKIFNDEQFIKNYIILYNLLNRNKATSQIYSLRDIIKDTDK